MGFTPVGYQGLETGSRKVAAHLVQQNKVENKYPTVRYLNYLSIECFFQN
jgi:hypothetical protein